MSPCNVLFRTGNPGKYWPELPGITFGLELMPYSQSSLYIQYLVAPSLAIYSTFPPQCVSGHGKQHCIPPLQCWSIRPHCSSSSFHLIWASPPSHRTSLFTIFTRLSHHFTSLLQVTLANRRQTLLILVGTDFGHKLVSGHNLGICSTLATSGLLSSYLFYTVLVSFLRNVWAGL